MNTVANALVDIDHEPTARREIAAVTPMAMIDRALASNATPETLERLLALQERWEASQARKAFDEAMAAAKEEFQPILTNRRVAFESKDKTKADTNYKFEDLAQIERQVGPILTKNGLSYRYRTQAEPDQPVRVTCIVAHKSGHSEETSLAAGRDNSGNKNSIQAIGSTITYLQRYTLKAALGLAVAHDDDGKKADEAIDQFITDAQRDTLLGLINETGTDVAKFCEWAKIEGVSQLLARYYDKAVSVLQERKGKAA